MNASALLRRAAAAMCGPAAYSRHADGLAYLAKMRPYNATSALERASCRLRSGAAFCARGDPVVLAEAKAMVCRVIGFPHIAMWEAEKRPAWEDVRRAFLEAAC